MRRICVIACLLWCGLWTGAAAQGIPGTPTLLSPASGTGNLPINLICSWSTLTGAMSYTIEVATDSLFATPAVDLFGTIATFQAITNLNSGTTYYWRVNGIDSAGTAGAWSSVWNFKTMQSPKIPALISPSNDTINISAAAYQLSWSPDTGVAVTYGVQVSLFVNFGDITYDSTGISSSSINLTGDLNDVMYYWRVNATTGGGTSAWSNAWSFTTIIAAPGSCSPSNGAVNQPLSPTLSWDQVIGAPSYSVQISTASDLSNNLQITTDTIPQVIRGLQNNTVYYWRVGTNGKGATNWSATLQFTTIPAVPVAPALSSPTNNAKNQPLSLTLAWATTGSNAQVAASYSMQVSTTTSFATTVLAQSGITGTTCPLTWLANSTMYYWQANATNAGGTSTWSEIWSFTTAPPVVPPVPVLALPSNASLNMVSPATLSWDRILGATIYTLEVATVSNFSTTIFRTSGATISVTVSDLDTDQTYYWQVNAGNAAGTSVWSGVWSFITISGPPTIPVLKSGPGFTIPEKFSWDTAAGASTYAMQISNDYYFSTTTFSQTGITGTSLTLASTIDGGYWHINASNVYGTSAWSSVWSFTLSMCKSLETVGQVSPAASTTTYVQLPVTFSWTYIPGCGSGEAVPYTLQVATDKGFSSLVVNTNTFTVSGVPSIEWTYSYTAYNLNNSTTYYWRNRQGSGAWSSVSQFTTVIASPQLSLPIDSAQNQPLSVSLSWGTVNGAADYRVQLSTASDFSGTTTSSNLLSAVSFAAGPLANNTVYYWRVGDSGTDGSAWSAVWSFTVGVTRAEETEAMLNQSGIYLRGSMLFYRLTIPGMVEISLYDIIGKKMMLLNRLLPAGRYSLSLRTPDFAHGLYILHFKAPTLEKRITVVLIQ